MHIELLEKPLNLTVMEVQMKAQYPYTPNQNVHNDNLWSGGIAWNPYHFHVTGEKRV